MSEFFKVLSIEAPLANRGRFAGHFLRSLPLPGEGPDRRTAILEAAVALMSGLQLDEHATEREMLAHYAPRFRNPDAHAHDVGAEIFEAIAGHGNANGARQIVACGGRGSEASLTALEAVISKVIADEAHPSSKESHV